MERKCVRVVLDSVSLYLFPKSQFGRREFTLAFTLFSCLWGKRRKWVRERELYRGQHQLVYWTWFFLYTSSNIQHVVLSWAFYLLFCCARRKINQYWTTILYLQTWASFTLLYFTFSSLKNQMLSHQHHQSTFYHQNRNRVSISLSISSFKWEFNS